LSSPEGGFLPNERTMVGALGIEVLEHTDDMVRGRLPVGDNVRQPYGIVHGGAILALAETLASFGTAVGVMEDGRLAMGQEINASYMRPISEGHVNATARVRRRGRSAWVWEVEIEDDAGRLCSLVRLTIAVREPSAPMSETIRDARGQSEPQPGGGKP
jgi:1,4-dihydroxy-2-naphthoyl-CoA hydrolase